jgi:hypothetical protein
VEVGDLRWLSLRRFEVDKKKRCELSLVASKLGS